MQLQITYEAVGCTELVQWQAVQKVVINSASVRAFNFLTSSRHRLEKQQVYSLIPYTRDATETFIAIDLAAPALLLLKQTASRITIELDGGCDLHIHCRSEIC